MSLITVPFSGIELLGEQGINFLRKELLVIGEKVLVISLYRTGVSHDDDEDKF